MNEVSAIVIEPMPNGTFDHQPCVVRPAFADIAAKLGVPEDQLGWIRHGRCVYFTSRSGPRPFTDVYCEEHPILLNGRTLMFGLGYHDKWPNNLHNFTTREFEDIVRVSQYISGEAEGAFHPAPLPVPLIPIDGTPPTSAPAGLAAVLQHLLGPSTSVQARSVIEATIGSEFTIDPANPATYPTAIEPVLLTIDSWHSGLKDKIMGLSPELISRHATLGYLLLDNIKTFIEEHRELISALGRNPDELIGSIDGEGIKADVSHS